MNQWRPRGWCCNCGLVRAGMQYIPPFDEGYMTLLLSGGRFCNSGVGKDSFAALRMTERALRMTERAHRMSVGAVRMKGGMPGMTDGAHDGCVFHWKSLSCSMMRWIHVIALLFVLPPPPPRRQQHKKQRYDMNPSHHAAR